MNKIFINIGTVNGNTYTLTLDSGDNTAAGITVAVFDNGDLIIRDSGYTTFSGTVGAGTEGAITITDTTGTVTFQGAVVASSFTTTAQGYSIAFNGGVTIADGYTKFLNTGGVTFGNEETDTIIFDELAVTSGITVLNSNVAVNNLTVLGSATLSLGANTTMTVSGNFRVYGTFTAGSESTVVFGDASLPSYVYGTTFVNLTIDAGKTVYFEAGQTETITGVFTANGAPGNLITLRSTIDGSRWNINPQGTWTVSYIDIKDCTNMNIADIAPIGSVDSGNTTRWFPIVVPDPEEPVEPPEEEEEESPDIELYEGEELVGEMSLLEEDGDPEENDYFDSWANGEDYSRQYRKGLWRTTVICFEGWVLVNREYDERGAMYQEKHTISLTDGEKTIIEYKN